MNLLDPTPAGIAAAAALVVAGAPLFSAGLRVLRLRRRLKALSERPLAEAPSGFVLVRGRVGLDSPLVGPLSGKPCAGFVLDVRGAGLAPRIQERRPFRLKAGDVVAQVLAGDGTWEMEVTAERSFAANEAPSQNLEALLDGSVEAAWIRRSRVPFTVVERALLAGHECFVIGHGRHLRPFELPEEVELARTGTDDRAMNADVRRTAAEPDLWIEADGHLGFLRISDRPLVPAAFTPPPWGLVLVAAGPLLSLTGLVYLARAAERLSDLSLR